MFRFLFNEGRNCTYALQGTIRDGHSMKVVMWKGTEKGERPAKLTGETRMKEIIETGRESQEQYDKIAIFS